MCKLVNPRQALFLVLAAASLGIGTGAHAAEATRVVSGSRSRGELFDFNLSLAWLREQKTAVIRREFQGQATGGQTGVVNDLVYQQTRNVLALRADAGIIGDVSLFFVAPLVLTDDRSLGFDRRDASCDALMGGASSECVNDSTSTLLRDGILPGARSAKYGWDTLHGRPFERPSEGVFQGPTRKGFEYLGLGINWAIFNQLRDDTKPTWMVRFESRFSVSQSMRFDPAQPTANTGVGLGYHQFVFSTLFSRHFGRLDPYVSGWYMAPQMTAGSPYKDFTLGTKGFGGPQHRAGTEFGIEGVIWEQPQARQRVTLELRGRYELRFFGLAHSELWEVLSGPSTCKTEPGTCRPNLDRDLNGDGLPDANPGITRTPSYGVLGGDAGINVQVGRYIRFRGLFGMSFEQDRFLTDGRSGNEAYDIPGRRFRVDDARIWSLALEGALLF